MKTALITGVTGQDGSYLAERLLSDGYMVTGLRVGIESLNNLNACLAHPNFALIDGELLDQAFLIELVASLKPDRLFNLAGQSFVPLSWKQPVFTGDFNGLTVARLLEAIRMRSRHTRFYQASSSEMFGNSLDSRITEQTPLAPCSPYAAAKAFGHHLVNVYRESYGLFACSGMLFNHESPRRGHEFVTQKIVQAVARIVAGDADVLELGNGDAARDWGYAPDYVNAMVLMLDHDEPDDYVIATGEAHTVRQFCALAFQSAGIQDWQSHVRFNTANLERPKDVDYLCGDPTKARTVLEWNPTVSFTQLVEIMVSAALHRPTVTHYMTWSPSCP